MKKGDLIQTDITSVAYKGVGIAKMQQEDGRDLVMFVEGTVPGQTVEAMVLKKKSTFVEAKKKRILKQAPYEIAPKCPYFGVCGGCMWQHLPYEKQLEFKQQFIVESLTHIGGLSDLPYLPMIPSPSPWNYRNKIELSFGTTAFLADHEMGAMSEQGRYLGYHGKGSFHKIVDVASCDLFDPVLTPVLLTLRKFLEKHRLPAYNAKTHEGFLRHLGVRHGQNTGELMLHLVTSSTDDYTEEFFLPLVEEWKLLESDQLKIESILWTTHDSLSDVIRNGTTRILSGRDYIFEKVGGYLFKISSHSFFQTNTKGAEVLYDTVARVADVAEGDVVVDLYAGTGTIGMYLAKQAKRVFSIEENIQAVADAKTNAVLNNILNIEFLSGKVEHDAHGLLFERPNVVIVDPPRAGMHPKALELLPKFQAKKIVYVSCNPTTLARDLKELSKRYDIVSVQGVDMFPQTYHVETVVLLTKKHG